MTTWAVEVKRSMWRDWFRLSATFATKEQADAGRRLASEVYPDAWTRVVRATSDIPTIEPRPGDPRRGGRDAAAEHSFDSHPPAQKLQYPHEGQRPVPV